MPNFEEPITLPEFDQTRDDFGQAMFGINWFNYSDDRVQGETLPPWMLDRNAMTCPTGHICVPENGTNGMFVRSRQDGKLYFSEDGYQRYQDGPDTDKAAVARDLLGIVGGSLGGLAPGIVGLLAQALEIGSYAIDCWFNDNC